MKTIAIATVAGFAAVSAAQSVATFTVTPSATEIAPGGTVTFEVTAQADSGLVGNNSGIGGVNLSVDIANGTLDMGSLSATSSAFGQVNTDESDSNFQISFQANSFAGDNFDIGEVLFSFSVTAGDIGTLDISTSQGSLSGFNAAVGIPAPFGTAVAYDTVNFGGASVNVIPAPGAVAVLGLGGLAAARRRR